MSLARIRIVRHGEARGGDPADADPGLSDQGRLQADEAAARLAADPAERLTTSPRRRAVETAWLLGARLGLEPGLEQAYVELPWREGSTVADRHADVRAVLSAGWASAPGSTLAWRQALIAAALAERGDVVIVSHLVAINALVGDATGDPRAYLFHPDNASVTELAVENGRLRLVSLGRAPASLPRF